MLALKKQLRKIAKLDPDLLLQVAIADMGDDICRFPVLERPVYTGYSLQGPFFPSEQVAGKLASLVLEYADGDVLLSVKSRIMTLALTEQDAIPSAAFFLHVPLTKSLAEEYELERPIILMMELFPRLRMLYHV